MGLGDITPDDTSDTGGSSSSSSSSSGSSSSGTSVSRMTLSGVSPGDFPVKVAKTPYLIIKETDGGYEAVWYPDTPEVTVEFDWYGSFEYIGDRDWKKVFWTRDEYQAYASRVKKKVDSDLTTLLEADVEEGVRALRKAANEYLDISVDETVDCAVCETSLHPRYDDTEMVSNRRVCINHTVTELKESGLIE